MGLAPLLRRAASPWRGLEGLPRSVWILSAATLLNRAGTMALPFLVLYLNKGLGLPAARAGQAFIAYGLAAMVAAPLGGWLADRVGHLRVMVLSLALSGALLAGLPLLSSWPGILALTVAWSLASEAFRPASMAILTDLAPLENRKAVFALNRLAINLGMSVGPAIGGFLAVHSFKALFWLDGLTSLLAAGVIMAFVRVQEVRHARGAEPGATEAPPASTQATWWSAFTRMSASSSLSGFCPALRSYTLEPAIGWPGLRHSAIASWTTLSVARHRQ